VQKCGLTIQGSTKLNRSHLIYGRDALILPCLGRAEKDHGNEGLQGITVEDSMSMVHLSSSRAKPTMNKSPKERLLHNLIVGGRTTRKPQQPDGRDHQ
jgi:hypothetical protein